MTAYTNPNAPDSRVGILRDIANRIEPAFPSAADSLRGVANGLGQSELEAGLRARLRLTEKAISAIEDEHSATANGKYCREDSCHECDVIERINLALAGEPANKN